MSFNFFCCCFNQMFCKKLFKKKKKIEYEYGKIMADFNKQIKKAQNDEEKVDLFNEFSSNYLLSKTLWWEMMKLSWDNHESPKYDFYKKGIYHFYYNSNITNEFGHQLKLMGEYANFPYGNSSYDLMEKDHHLFVKNVKELMYPQKHLKRFLMWYEEYSSSPISQELIKNAEKMQKLYWKIIFSEDNLEEWIECLKEAGDHEFVRHNVENRIGQKLSNKNLWKLYISYLRETDPEEMLQVYSKYCRFFLDDLEMKNEYKNATEKYGPVYVPWKNPFEFETYLPWIDENRERIKSDSSDIKEKSPQFDFSKSMEIFKQRWSLPTPLIHHFLDNARPQIFSEIQKICKYLFLKKQKLYCYRFLYTDYSKHNRSIPWFLEHSLRIYPDCSKLSLKPFETKNLIITMSLKIEYDTPSSSLSDIIKNYIYECHVKYIYICCQIITKDEFHFLTRHGNVESFELIKTRILKSDEASSISLKEILKMLPKIRVFKIYRYEQNFSPFFDDLSELKFQNKFLYFSFEYINNEINADDFCNFLKENTLHFTEMELIFHIDFDEQLILKLEKAILSMYKEWKPLNELPWLQFHQREF